MDKKRIEVFRAAKRLGVCKRTVHRMIHEGRLIGVKVCGRWWVYEDSIEKYIQKQTTSNKNTIKINDPIDLRRKTIREIRELERKVFWLKRSNAKLLNNNMPVIGYNKNKLINKDDILSQAVSFSVVRGVYFLIRDNEIVYVGQSVNILKRIASHTTGQDQKLFDSFSYIAVHEKDNLQWLESEYINKFKPIYNKVMGKIACNHD